MSKIFIHILLLTLTALASKASDLRIAVRDESTGQLLTNVYLDYQHKQLNAKLSSSGNEGFLIKNIAYPISISCSKPDYETLMISLEKNEVKVKDGIDFYTIFLKRTATQINDVVVTGQVVPVMAKQSIYKVNTLSSLEINQRAAVSLNDLLNFEMNHFISNDNILGSSVNIGGIGGQNVKVLLNGVPVTGRENGNIDMGQLNLNNIKRVEMIQGPMSVIYGSNALGGVINLITATPKKKLDLGIRTYYESIGRYNVSGNMGLKHKNHQLQLSLARNYFAGWTPKDSIDRFQLWKPKLQYTSDLQYQWTYKKLKLNYFASYLKEKITNKGEPIINPYEGYAFDEYYRTQRLIQSISSQIKLNNTDQFNFSNSFQSYKRTKNRMKKDLVSLIEFETKNVGDQDTTKFYDINLRGTYSTTRFKHTEMLLGYEFTSETGLSYKLADQRKNMTETGIFGSLLFTHHKIQLQPSARWTYNNRYKSNFTPAFHAKFDVNANTQLRASYALGYRAPTLKEMYLQFIDQNHTIIGNPELKPETGSHVEIGMESKKKFRKLNVGYGVNAYYNSIHNLIALAVFNNHGVLRQYANIQHYRNYILNANGKMTFSKLTLSTGAGIIFVPQNNILPEHKILEYTFNANYFIKKIKTGIYLNYKFNSQQPVITIDQQYLYTNPLHIANLSIQRHFFNKSLNAQLGLKNLFNIQNSTLNGSIDTQNSGHTNNGSMIVFPARSLFIDLTYSL